MYEALGAAPAVAVRLIRNRFDLLLGLRPQVDPGRTGWSRGADGVRQRTDAGEEYDPAVARLRAAVVGFGPDVGERDLEISSRNAWLRRAGLRTRRVDARAAHKIAIVARVPSAVVLGVGGAAGVSALRLLGRRGLRVYAVDNRLSALGFRSRYAVARRVPDPERNAREFAGALQALGDELGGEVPIFPARDEDLNALARIAPSLANRFLYPFPDWETLEPIQQKRFQVERAAELGVPTPVTVDDPSDARRFPVLIKPSRPAGFRGRFGKQALVCRDRGELEAAFESARQFDPLIQEVIPGDDRQLFTLGVYIDRRGVALGVFCGRKLRQTPRSVGTCRVGESLWVDSVVEQGLGLLNGLEYTGIAQVEFKYDRRDRKFKFIEVNPRLWQWHENAAICGVDLPWIAYEDLTGVRVPCVSSKGCRKRWALTFYDGLVPALARPRYLDPFLVADDPRLAITHMARVARRSLARRRG